MTQLNILNSKGSIISELLIQLRDKDLQKSPSSFRQNLRQIGRLMAYEVTKTFQYEVVEVQTSLGTAKEFKMSEEVVLISILRAAAPMAEGFSETLPNAELGMIGSMRREGNEIEIDLSYVALPELAGKRVVVIDPMLATAKSMVKTVGTLLERGTPANLDIACLVSAPEGIEYLKQNISVPYNLWTCAVDSHLNDQHYIVPGLGDAGDLAFGRKK